MSKVKTCPQCNKEKSTNDFSKCKSTISGLSCWCKSCCKKWHQENKEYVRNYKKKYYKKHFKLISSNRKKYYNKNRKRLLKKTKEYVQKFPEKVKNTVLKREFGITINDYNRMLKEQNGVCAICKNPESVIDYRTKDVYSLAVDHNHKTGKVRGLLCTSCNHMLGHAKENYNILQTAIIYLKSHNAK